MNDGIHRLKLKQGGCMRSCIVLATALSLLMIGCSDEKATAEREKATAKLAAEQQAEQKLMSEMATAGPELQRRIDGWVKADNGLLFVIDNSGGPTFNLHALPASTPWHVSCNAEEFEVTLGNWEEGGNRNAKLFTQALSYASFSEEQCKRLATVVARKMIAITATARSR